MAKTTDDLPNLGKLIKLMQLTKSSMDGEALSAIRMANRELDKFGGDWETLLRGKVTVIGDPFAGLATPPPQRNAPPVRKPTPPPPPMQTWPKHPPVKPQPQPAPQFNPSAAQPAQPFSHMSFHKTMSGHWRVKSSRPLVIGDHYEIPTRSSGLRRVKITGADGTNQYGDYLYTSINAPHSAGAVL